MIDLLKSPLKFPGDISKGAYSKVILGWRECGAPLALGTRRFCVDTETQKVNFSESTLLVDNQIANACIVVATNDGEFGTLSHLTIMDSAELFASDLRALIGKSNVPVCLAGGDSEWRGSPELVSKLKLALILEGFIIGDCDVLGRFSRHCKLERSCLRVTRSPCFDDENRKELKLKFLGKRDYKILDMWRDYIGRAKLVPPR